MMASGYDLFGELAMHRILALLLIVIGLATVPAAAAQDKKILNKTASEWLQLLRTSKEEKQRQVAMFALENFTGKDAGMVGALFEMLGKSEDADVRVAVATLLGRLGPDA